MSSSRIPRWAAQAAMCAAVAGAAVAAPVQAEPLWPGGPDVPGVPAIIPAPEPEPVVAPCSEKARACLQLSTNNAWLMDNGKVTFGPTPMSHGRPGYETPPGVFKVAFKKPFHWSTLHNAPMEYAVFFNGDIAYHIGPTEEQSHGCIRLTPEGAKAHYDWLEPGDIVEVVP
ncbi:L,D-transpeptidase [Nocardia neocaledoniensis]|nr:L,D-transpeptidase [Nocardia neocaledoniensis]